MLVKTASMGKYNKRSKMNLNTEEEPSIEELKMIGRNGDAMMIEEDSECWIDPIFKYLANGEIPNDRKKQGKLNSKS